MYPVHVDQVMRKSEKFEMHAGPIYELPKTFGKVGMKLSFAGKNRYEDNILRK